MSNLDKKINDLITSKDIVIIGIEGPCASGKTTFAGILAKKYDANLFHMDDFFLRPEQRNPARFSEPGGNIDHERFREEVLENIVKGTAFRFKPFSCSNGRLDYDIDVPFKKLNIVEGVYSMHPNLMPFYDIKIYMKIPRSEQLKRLRDRDESKFERFINEWIPLEDKYFSYFGIEKSCDFAINGLNSEEI